MDKKTLLNKIKQNKFSDEETALENASDILCDDRDIALAAVTQDSYNFDFVSDRLRDDKEIALIAVSDFGGFLHIVSERLQNDRDVVIAAIRDNTDAIVYASGRLQNDVNIIETCDQLKKDTFPIYTHYYPCDGRCPVCQKSLDSGQVILTLDDGASLHNHFHDSGHHDFMHLSLRACDIHCCSKACMKKFLCDAVDRLDDVK